MTAKKKTKNTTMPEPSGVKEILQTSLSEDDDRRQGGDGESLPHTPPNEAVSFDHRKEFAPSNPFLVNLKVDVMAVTLFIVGLATRLYRIDQPKNVV